MHISLRARHHLNVGELIISTGAMLIRFLGACKQSFAIARYVYTFSTYAAYLKILQSLVNRWMCPQR